VFGLCIGTNLVALIVVSGLAAIILATTWARNYIAARIAFAGKKIAFIHAEEIPGIRDALILQIINPKAYAVNMTWFTGFVLVPESLVAETLIKFFVINLIWIPIHLLWLAAGNLVNRLDLSPRTHFLINGAMALALVIVVALAIVSLL
jgi:threonine/homoserine/homoserine lactone efflux protein